MGSLRDYTIPATPQLAVLGNCNNGLQVHLTTQAFVCMVEHNACMLHGLGQCRQKDSNIQNGGNLGSLAI